VARRKCAWMSRPSFVLQSTTFGPLRPAPTDSRGSCSRQPSSFFTDLRRLSKAVTGGEWTNLWSPRLRHRRVHLWKSGRGVAVLIFEKPTVNRMFTKSARQLSHRSTTLIRSFKEGLSFRPPLVARVPACSIRPSPVCRGADGKTDRLV